MQSIVAKFALTNLRLYVADMLLVAAAATQNGESPRWLTEQHDVAVSLRGVQQAPTEAEDVNGVLRKACLAAWAGRVREHIPIVQHIPQSWCCYWGEIMQPLEPLARALPWQLHTSAT